MSSSEPRLSRPLTVGSAPELTGADGNPLKSTVPRATHILVVGVMLLFFVTATLITLQATWEWWIIDCLIAVPVLLVLVQRFNRVQVARRQRLALEATLGRGRSAGAGR